MKHLNSHNNNSNTILQLLRRTILPSSFASQESINKKVLPIVGNGAYLALASGFLMTDMLQLRLLLVGGYAGLVCFHSLHHKPLQIPLRWSALFVLVNTCAASMLFMDEWIGALLSDEELSLYEKHFKEEGLTKGQFYNLIRMSRKQHIKDGKLLTQEGRCSPNLYFLCEGRAKVFHNGSFAAYIDEGGFVNDVAFQQRQEEVDDSHDSDNQDNIGIDMNIRGGPSVGVGAYGTVITRGYCTVLVWDQSELKHYLENNPVMERNMKYTLSRHLVKSLLKQRDARRSRRGAEDQQHLSDIDTELRRIQTISNRVVDSNTYHDRNKNGEDDVDNNSQDGRYVMTLW